MLMDSFSSLREFFNPADSSHPARPGLGFHCVPQKWNPEDPRQGHDAPDLLPTQHGILTQREAGSVLSGLNSLADIPPLPQEEVPCSSNTLKNVPAPQTDENYVVIVQRLALCLVGD